MPNTHYKLQILFLKLIEQLPEWSELEDNLLIFNEKTLIYLQNLKLSYLQVDPQDLLKLPDPSTRIRLQKRAKIAILLVEIEAEYSSLMRQHYYGFDNTLTNSRCTQSLEF